MVDSRVILKIKLRNPDKIFISGSDSSSVGGEF